MIIAETGDKKTVSLRLNFANRHGLIAGATGTGKTVSLQRLAEGFSQAGVPVFMADVKGDLSGMSQAGTLNPKLQKRLEERSWVVPEWKANPTIFWDIQGKKGHPLKTTLTEMGPLLLQRLMELNETQASVLQVIFRIADEHKLILIDLKDLNSLISFVQQNLEKFKVDYGHISQASLGTIQRKLLTLLEQEVGAFFGEPALDIHDLMQTDAAGRGYINILMAEELLQTPLVYSTMLLWLLAELFEQLPEVGDLDKPKLVFFFDEAHLLFKDVPKALLEKIELVVRLIRSKGVGVYFVTQNPADVPATVIGQLSHRIQHGLKAFTPQDQKSVKAAAQTMRPNPSFVTDKVITELAVGEALVSLLDENGSPTIVERSFILPPGSRIGAISESERQEIRQQSPLGNHYEQMIDRVSAYEQMKVSEPKGEEPVGKSPESPGVGEVLNDLLFGSTGPRGGRKAGLIEKAATSAARTAGRELLRGLMGSLMSGGGRRKN